MTGDIRGREHEAVAVARSATVLPPKHPTLLAIEDVHWLDSSSWGLLLDVAQWVRPLMTLAATRPLGDPVSNRLLAASCSLAGERQSRARGTVGATRRERSSPRGSACPDVPPSLATFVEERVRRPSVLL
jgi:hypothetical protein